jgi:hypothetical protein
MKFYNGTDRILYIKLNGVYTPVGCLTGNSISESVEMLDTTTLENDGWKTSRPTGQSYSISFEGVQINTTMAGGNFNIASYDRLKLIKRNRQLIDWKIKGTVYPVVDFGKGFISDISDSENVDEFMTFSGTITGFGKPEIEDLGGIVLNDGDPNRLIVSENNLIKIK